VTLLTSQVATGLDGTPGMADGTPGMPGMNGINFP
jgi:hypothetical protein